MFEDAADAADLFALREVRRHLFADRQPDRRRVRGAGRQPGRRHRRRRRGSGQSAEFLTDRRAVPEPAITSCRRHSSTAARARCSRSRCARFGIVTTFVPGTDPATFAAAIGPQTTLRVHRAHRQPVGCRRRPRGPGRCRPCRRDPADRRLDHGHAVPVPADGVGSRHRAPLGDEVPGVGTAPRSAGWSSSRSLRLRATATSRR